MQVRAIQLRIVCQLARLHDSGVELLAGCFAAVEPMPLQQFAASLSQGDERRLLAPDDVWIIEALQAQARQ